MTDGSRGPDVQDRHIVIVGQGYVGLPLAVAASRSGAPSSASTSTRPASTA
jgi:glycine/D-amino acid oxidase-like deaminating enzyme